MNLNLLVRSLKERWISALTFIASLFLYSFLLAAIAPVFLGKPEFKQIIEHYPKEILAFMTGAGGANFFSVEGFFSIEYLSLWWIIIIAGFAFAAASAMVSKEMEEGTIEFLVAQPLSRLSLIITKFVALILYLALIISISLASLKLLAVAYDLDIKASGVFAVGIVALAFLIAISAYTLLLSVLLKSRGLSVAISVALLIASHLLNGFAQINKTVKDFQFLSLFKYYDSYKALTTGDIPWSDVGIFLAVAAACFVLSILVFRKKDIAVA